MPVVMNPSFEELEQKARLLAPHEKASLARTLIAELESEINEAVEGLWDEEARKRYQAYRSGELKSLAGDEVMSRARNRLND